MTAAVTLPVLGVGIAATKSFLDFDDAINQSLAIVTDMGGRTRAEFEKTARDVAKSTTFSATEAAESFFFLASAGLDTSQQLESLPAVAAFAQAGMFDMATATDLATDAQSALGLTVPDAARNLENMVRITDVLVKANTLANASVEQFATSLTNKAATALKLLNKDVEEGVAVLAVYADQGIKGQIAGESLSRVLKGLQINAEKNKDAFKELNIEVFDQDGNMRNLADVTDDLSNALLHLSDEEKVAALSALGFQAKQQDVIKTLLGTGDQIREYERQLRDAAGTTDTVMGKQLESFRARLELAKSAIADVGLELGAELVPIVLRVVEVVAGIASGFAALPGPVKQAILAVLGITALAGPLLLIAGKVAQTTLAFRQLQAAQLGVATSSIAAGRGLAGGAALQGGAIGLAGGRTGAALAGGVGLNAALRGGLVKQKGGIKGALGNVFGKGGKGAAKFSAGGLMRGIGISFATELGAGLIHGIDTEEGTVKDQLKRTTSGALRGAGLGALVGSAVPVLGTALGAGIGGAIGGALGFFGSPDAKAQVEAGAGDLADTLLKAIDTQFDSERLKAAVAATAEQGIGQGIELAAIRGANLERQAAVGDQIEELFRQAIIAGIDPDDLGGLINDQSVEAIERGLALSGAGTGLGIGGGGGDPIGGIITQALADAAARGAADAEDSVGESIEGVFANVFSAARGAGASITQAMQAGLDSGGTLNLGTVADEIAGSLSTLPSLFENQFDNAKTTSTAKMLELVSENAEAFAAFEDNIRTLTEAGLVGIAETIASQGPAAAHAAEDLVSSLTEGDTAPFAIEAKLQGIAEEDINAFLKVFENASPEVQAVGFVGRFIDPFETTLTQEAGSNLGGAFGFGIGIGMERTAIGAARIAKERAQAIVAATREGLGISSPSKFGIEIGENFANSINTGIGSIAIATPNLPDVPAITRREVGGGGTVTTINRTTNVTINNPSVESADRDAQRGAVMDRLRGVA